MRADFSKGLSPMCVQTVAGFPSFPVWEAVSVTQRVPSSSEVVSL